MKKNSICPPFVIAIGFIVLIIKPWAAQAQHPFQHDTSYYTTYPDKLTVRTYLSQKYAPFTLPAFDVTGIKDIRYTPNAKLNMGIGATYHNFTLNVGYGFSFLNNNNDEKGKSKSLDLQLHLYRHRWVIDLLGMSYKGEYISPKGYAAADANSYYYRPDVKFNFVGVAGYHLSNPEKFSYNAAMIQNEWQKKSAGTLLYGGEVYYGTLKGDSALIPQYVAKEFPQEGINKINFFRAGPGIGYAYTLVIKKHFFITGSLIGNLDLNLTSEDGINGKSTKASVNPGAVYKAAIGYNSDTWSLTGTWAGNASWISSTISSSEKYFLPTGNFRVMLAKKNKL